MNIKKGSSWIGLDIVQDDKTFCRFCDVIFGLRAGMFLLRKYIDVYNLQSIRLIVSKWAPSSENATEKYIQFVSERTGINRECLVNFNDADKIVSIVEAMCFMECGRKVPMEYIRSAYWVLKVFG